jgi:hypothetical protein
LAEFFEYVRIERPDDMPARDPRAIEVAVLDMNHGFPNVGHDAIVFAVRELAGELLENAASPQRVRVLSYAVRDRLMVPDHAQGRHRLYLGTGGPGHLDPRLNTHENGTERIREDPAWEAPLWRLFEAISNDQDSALFGVCHTFGLLCRWLGVATPVLRCPEKGGFRGGVGTNVLSREALGHPWFAQLAAELSSDVVTVLDSRYYDLITSGASFSAGVTPIAFESATQAGGEVLTMLEVARDRSGRIPRVFGDNSHPEIGSAERIAELLERLLANGTITPEVYEARKILLPALRTERRDARLRVARATFDDLVRGQLETIVRAA